MTTAQGLHGKLNLLLLSDPLQPLSPADLLIQKKKKKSRQKPKTDKQLWHKMAFVAVCFNLMNYCSKLQERTSHTTRAHGGNRSYTHLGLLPRVSTAPSLIRSSCSLILSVPLTNHFNSPAVPFTLPAQNPEEIYI